MLRRPRVINSGTVWGIPMGRLWAGRGAGRRLRAYKYSLSSKIVMPTGLLNWTILTIHLESEEAINATSISCIG